jgi:hypothetical protein
MLVWSTTGNVVRQKRSDRKSKDKRKGKTAKQFGFHWVRRVWQSERATKAQFACGALKHTPAKRNSKRRPDQPFAPIRRSVLRSDL